MAADLHIHVLEGVTETDVIRWQAPMLSGEVFDELCDKISDTPSVWVGEVSWLKAAIFSDSKTFVPDPVQAVAEIVGRHLPVCDDDLIERVHQAMLLPNSTTYSIATADKILEFLRAHRGKRLFQVSW